MISVGLSRRLFLGSSAAMAGALASARMIPLGYASEAPGPGVAAAGTPAAPVAAEHPELALALQQAEVRYGAANPGSAAVFARAQQHMPGGNTRTVLYYSPFPLALAGGDGCYVADVDGHRYLDTVSEQTAGLYGHSNKAIERAVSEALRQGIVLGGPTEREAALAEQLCSRFPALEMVRFTNSGTEANLFALCASRAITGRSQVLVFEGSYHGGVLTFSGSGNMNVPFPYVMAPYNDTERTLALIEAHKDSLAAVLIEPMVGGGGCIPAKPEFLEALRTVTSRYGILLIFDEVMTSRLSPGGLQAVVGITPDLMTMGKYLGGGLTFGAFGGRADLMNRFDPGRPGFLSHAGTFNNNVLTLAAGEAGLREVLTPEASLRLNRDGDRLRERLQATIARHGAPGTVTGYGSMMMIQLAAGEYQQPRDTARVPTALRALCQHTMLAQGIYMSRRNMLNLSLPMEAEDFERVVAAFDGFLTEHSGLLAAG